MPPEIPDTIRVACIGEAMAELMLGSRDIVAVRKERAIGNARMTINNLHIDSDEQPLQINNLQLFGGEVFGVAGVAGNGQELLFAALSGESRSKLPESITIDDQPVGNLGPNERREHQAMFIPEERLGHAAVPHMDLVDNALLTNLSNPKAAKYGVVNKKFLVEETRQIVDQFDVRHGGINRAAKNLSGGNLQKFVVGREMNKSPAILIVNQPTWGVDALSAVRIREALMELAAGGSAILVISQDLDELLEISDRLAVLHHGVLGEARPIHEWTVEALGLAMTGGTITEQAS